MKKNWPVLALAAVAALVAAYVFDSKLDIGGDNAGYYILGQSIAEGHGYTNIHLFNQSAASHFPPGYPLIVAILMMVSSSFVWLKVANVAMFIGTLLLLRPMVRDITKSEEVAWVVLALVLFNAHLLRYSTIMMSEIPFLFVSVLTLSALMQWQKSEAGSRNYWLLLSAVIVASVLSFHIRTAGIALIGGIIWYLVMQRQWRHAIIYGGGFGLLSLPWFLRGQSLGGNAYVNQLFMVNPYRPDEGQMASMGNWVDRISNNFSRYLGKELPNGMFPQLEVTYLDESSGWIVIGLLILVTAGYGIWKMPKWRALMLGYIGSSFIIFLLWPDVWYGIRFVLPIVPFIAVASIYGVYAFMKDRAKLSPYVLGVLVLPQLMALGPVRESAQKAHPNQFLEYFQMAEAIGQQSAEDAIICTTKPALFFLHGQRAAIRTPKTQDPAAFMAKLDDVGVDYVVVDAMGYSWALQSTQNALTAYPNRFRAVSKQSPMGTVVLEVLPATAESSVDASEPAPQP